MLMHGLWGIGTTCSDITGVVCRWEHSIWDCELSHWWVYDKCIVRTTCFRLCAGILSCSASPILLNRQLPSFLKMVSVASAGGSVINYSSRFSLTGMTGSFTSDVIQGLASVSGTDGRSEEHTSELQSQFHL